MSERARELRRRRKRRVQITKLSKRVKKANQSEVAFIAEKIRRMTPGAEVILKNWSATE